MRYGTQELGSHKHHKNYTDTQICNRADVKRPLMIIKLDGGNVNERPYSTKKQSS